MVPDYDLNLEPWTIDPARIPAADRGEERARFLLRFAILAPSSHNSQPWSFRIDGDRIELRIDESRWLRVADADMRELHLSLGCALENLLVAARHFGHSPRLRRAPEPGDVAATVELGPTGDADRPGGTLFDAILQRRTSHKEFAEAPLPENLADELQRVVKEEFDVELVVVDDGSRETVAELQRDADERQMDDEAYRSELAEWIGSGALGDSWPKARIARWVVTHFDLGEQEGQDNARHIRRAPLVGVLATSADCLEARLRAGQAYERIALMATSLGVATHPLSQILEVGPLKSRLADLLSLGESVPQHLFRAGRPAGTDRHTPRWPLETFLATGSY